MIKLLKITTLSLLLFSCQKEDSELNPSISNVENNFKDHPESLDETEDLLLDKTNDNSDGKKSKLKLNKPSKSPKLSRYLGPYCKEKRRKRGERFRMVATSIKNNLKQDVSILYLTFNEKTGKLSRARTKIKKGKSKTIFLDYNFTELLKVSFEVYTWNKNKRKWIRKSFRSKKFHNNCYKKVFMTTKG